MGEKTMVYRIVLCVIFASLVAGPLTAQHDEGSDYDHHHKHHELALGTGAVYMPAENIWGYGLHLHALAAITESMSLGAGYELILGEHTHHTLSGLLHFHPIHPLDINLGPGVVFPDGENDHFRFKMHVELASVFELGEHFHLGPGLDVGIGKHDLHIGFGIHAGWIFSSH
jgi:hypothetical protein